jgi:hypothetical protein
LNGKLTAGPVLRSPGKVSVSFVMQSACNSKYSLL